MPASPAGTRDDVSTDELTLTLNQNAVLTVTCPDGTTVNMPLIGMDIKNGILSMANGYTVTEQGDDNGTTWESEVLLDTPVNCNPHNGNSGSIMVISIRLYKALSFVVTP